VIAPEVTAPPTPFKGLAPFDDSPLDALYFFGRERELEVMVANVMANRLTVLYGPSGVGKTSLLRAGLAQRLRHDPEALVVPFSSWAGDALADLRGVVERSALAVADRELEPVRPGTPLADVLGVWSRRLEIGRAHV